MSDSAARHTQNWFTPVRFGLFLALLLFASFPQVFLGQQTFVARDYGFFVMPLAHFQQACFWHGEIPFWDPYNNCGVPFLAQWNTMALYPPALFYLLLPLGWSMGVFSLLHLWWAGLGMYFLARRWTDGDNFAAAFAGTAFVFNGLALNLIMWPSHMAAFGWMPWVILAVERAWRKGRQHILFAAFAGGLQMLAGSPEVTLFTWFVISVLWVQQFIKKESPRIAMLWRFPLVIGLVFTLAAVQLLPFLDLVAHAQRGAGYADLRWSMPAYGLANFLVPTAFGSTGTEGIFFQNGQYWTSSYYLGLGTLWLALLALTSVRDRRVWLLGGIAATGLVLALGGNTPVLPLLRKLVPQLTFITYPIKYVVLVIFAAPLLAALTLAKFSKAQKNLLPLGAVLFALLVAVLAWTQLAPLPGDNQHLAWTYGLARAGFLILIGLVLFALTLTQSSAMLRFAPLLLLLVVWLDVYTHEPNQNPTAPPWIYKPNLSREKLVLKPQPALGKSRVMVSPMAALQFVHVVLRDPKQNFLTKRLGYTSNCNLFDDVPKVNGFFSLTPHFSEKVQSLFYTTTNASYPQLENFMGVSHITSPKAVYRWQPRTHFLPLVTGGQKPFFFKDPSALYALTQNKFDGRKVVFLPPDEKADVTVSSPSRTRILESQFGNDTVNIEATATAPTLIVIAQSYYHDWRAEIDGKSTPLLRANVGFQAVQMPAGRHHIQLFYRDRAFDIGAVISICMWLGCFIALLLMLRRNRLGALIGAK